MIHVMDPILRCELSRFETFQLFIAMELSLLNFETLGKFILVVLDHVSICVFQQSL